MQRHHAPPPRNLAPHHGQAQGPNPQQNIIRLNQPVLSTLVHFDPQEMSFSNWYFLFNEFCFLNFVPEEPVYDEHIGPFPPHNRKRALFLTHVGARALDVLTKKSAPALPNQFPVPVLANTLRQYFEKPELQETYRFQLMGRIMLPQENLSDYATELQSLGAKCGFGANLDERLSERFISGAILPAAVRSHLISHPRLTFDEMVQYAQGQASLEEQTRMYARSLQLQQVSVATVKQLPYQHAPQQPYQHVPQQLYQPAPQLSYPQHQSRPVMWQPHGHDDSHQFQRDRQLVQQPLQRQELLPSQQSQYQQQQQGRQAPLQQRVGNQWQQPNTGQQQWNSNRARGPNKGKPFSAQQNSAGCMRCGRDHDSDTCSARDLQCNFCKKIGHIVRVCRSKHAQENGIRRPTSAAANWRSNHWVEEPQPPPNQSTRDHEEGTTPPCVGTCQPWSTANPNSAFERQWPDLGEQREDTDEAVAESILQSIPQFFVNRVVIVPRDNEYITAAVDSVVGVIPEPDEDIEGSSEDSMMGFVSEDELSHALEESLQEIQDILESEHTSPEQEPTPIHHNLDISGESAGPEMMEIFINGIPLMMELDSGAGASLLPVTIYKEKFVGIPLSPALVNLRSVSGPIDVKGSINVRVKLQKSAQETTLTLVIIDAPVNCPPLLGRNWLDALIPNWRNHFRAGIPTHAVSMDVVEQLKLQYAPVFDPNNDEPIRHFRVSIVMKEGFKPIFHRAYPVPFAMTQVMDAKLSELVDKDRAYPVRFSKWASPCVLVPKKAASKAVLGRQATPEANRMCVDFKKTVNPGAELDHYSMPVPSDMFAAMANGSCFTVLDLSDAYTQLELDEESQEIVTINTHRGLFRFRRLIYGLSCAPSIFQRTMDIILQGIENVFCYIDDILIKGISYQDCLKTVCIVLGRLAEFNVKLKLSKCVWFAPEVEYLGHVLAASGRRPAPSKVECIDRAPVPTSVREVRSFLGLVEFYSGYLPHISTILKPLSLLTHGNIKFEWNAQCDQAFTTIKQMIKDKVLIHFDPEKELVLMTDASPVGIGVALCHVVYENGRRKERPILFASCTLSERQARYAQIDREALGIIFGVTKCHKYLYGRKFSIVTDNAAIAHIFSPKKGLPVHAANRLINWAYILEAYAFNIIHRKADLLIVPDALSRLPATGQLHDVFLVPDLVGIPLTYLEVAQETARDTILSKVLECVHLGWPKANHPCITEELKPFYQKRLELSIVEKCLMRADRVVIPASLQAHVLKLLHIGHPGVVRTKMAARRVVYWIGMDSDIETFVENCAACRLINFKPSPELVPWPAAKYPFERVHVDFCQIQSVNFFVLCDAYSKWIHARVMTSTTAAVVTAELSEVFAVWGFPHLIIADNGPPFEAQEFNDFCTSYNISLLHSPAYHPQSNGPGERAVQIVKKSLRKLFQEPGSEKGITAHTQVALFLFTYRNTPSTATTKSPNEMLLSFAPRTLLSQIHPGRNPRNRTLESHDLFRENDLVLLRLGKQPVVQGRVVRKLSASRYLVSVKGVLKKPHLNQMTHAQSA